MGELMRKRSEAILGSSTATAPSDAGAAVSQRHSTAVTKVFTVCRISVAAVLLGCLCPTTASAFGIHGVPLNGSYIFVPSTPVSGVVPNALPFTDTFDQYPVPFWFEPPTNGWKQVASHGDLSTILSASEQWLWEYPGDASLFCGNYLNFSTEGQTLYQVTTGRTQNVWVDLSVLMVPCEDPPWEELTSGNQLGLFVDVTSNLTAYCGLTNRFASSGIQLMRKARLTLQFAYADSLSVPFFKVYIDQVAVRWSAGYRLPDVPSASGGEWLPCATTNRLFCGLGFMGNGGIDALKFSASNLGPDVPAQASLSHAGALSWRSDYGRTYQVETCTNLVGGLWQPFGSQILGDGKTNAVYDTVGSAPCKFYRVTPLK